MVDSECGACESGTEAGVSLAVSKFGLIVMGDNSEEYPDKTAVDRYCSGMCHACTGTTFPIVTALKVVREVRVVERELVV